MQQVRTFVLFQDGNIVYYKDKIMFRGQFQLTHGTTIILETNRPRRKSSTVSIDEVAKEYDKAKYIEIHTPLRVYYLTGVSTQKMTSYESARIWADKLKSVILSI